MLADGCPRWAAFSVDTLHTRRPAPRSPTLGRAANSHRHHEHRRATLLLTTPVALCPASVQGPFDFINFANHADIEPVFVTTSTTSVQDFAELVECKSLSGYSSGLCAQPPC